MANATPEDAAWVAMAPDLPAFSLSVGAILEDTDGDYWFDAPEEILIQDMDGDMDTDDASFFGVDDTINTSCPYSDDSTGILMFSFFQNTYTLLVSYIY